MKKAKYITVAAVVAALYAVITVCLRIAYAGIEFRIAEALNVLLLFTPAAVPGLFVGCVVSNLIGGNIIDAIFGSLTTLAAALLGRLIAKWLNKKQKRKGILPAILTCAPAVILNALVVPYILYFGYGIKEVGGYSGGFQVMAIQTAGVFIGEAVVCFLIGSILYLSLKKICGKNNILE